MRSQTVSTLIFLLICVLSGTILAAVPRSPQQLAQLLKQRDVLLASATSSQVDPENAAALQDKLGQLNSMIDAEAGARYSHLSGLYWYTDLQEARAAALKEGKPILSLRLLGHLTEELSCANSRFFRTILYPDAKIRVLLQERFILHWESVRQAPIITIDFGDGRKIVRTITGNSIHYVLAPDGEVVDALPGMYAPRRFGESLRIAEEAIVGANDRKVPAKRQRFEQYRQQVIERLQADWTVDLETWANHQPDQNWIKSVASLPLGNTPAQVNEDTFWIQLGAIHPDLGTLDASAREIVLPLRTPAKVAGKLAATKAIVELPGMRMIRNLEGSLRVDTLRNEYQFRSAILGWLQTNPAYRRNLVTLNAEVYSSLFHTPHDDPWLGLALPDAFTGIPQGGLVTSEAKDQPSSTANLPKSNQTQIKLETAVIQSDNKR